ncbi:MAG: hypothetical protein QG594_2121 [Bacteroidota bacterium]|nr:hypothetical protein [Bacteroidota bacterium]
MFPKRFHFLFTLFFLVLNLFAQDKGKTILLKKCIHEIEQQHQASFNYTEETVANIQLIPPKKSLSLEQKLEYLVLKTNLSFENIGNKFINIYKKNEPIKIICGYVFSNIDQKPIENANIILENGPISTNAAGYFEFKKSPKNDFLITHIGFVSKKITTTHLENKNCLKIILESEVTELPEIKTNPILASGISKNSDGSFEIKPKKFGILPGLIEPDALQTMQQIPGVNSLDESVSSINVRGGTHDQNLFLWNGIRMYQTGHFFGLISVFNPNLAHTISIFKNGSSAFYGESVSSVVAISSTPDAIEKNTYGAGINMINADIYAKQNLSEKSFIEISARKSITDYVETPTYTEYYNKAFQNTTITDFSQNQNINYESDKKFGFHDATFKFAQKIGTKNQLIVDLITLKDQLNVFQSATINSTTKSENNVLQQQNYGGNLFWKTNWNHFNSTKINANTSFYQLWANQKNTDEKQAVTQKNTVQNNGITIENNHIISSKFSLNNGYQFNEMGVTNLEQVSNPNFYQKTKDVLTTHALILEGKYNNPLAKIYLNAGARLNYIEKFKKLIFEPRLQLNYGIHKNLNVEILGELKSQTTQQVIDLQKDYLGIEKRRWILSDLNTVPIQRSQQLSVNFTFKKNNWLLSLENFYKEVTGITTQSQGFQNQLELIKLTGSYKVLGTEVLVQKRINHFWSWLSYTYNSNQYTFDDFKPPVFSNNFHIAHTVSWAGVFEKNNFNIALGARWNSGRPETTPASSAINPLNPSINYNLPNSERQNSFFQVNISSTYKWQNASHTQYKIGISVLNIFNTQNEISEYYRISNLTNTIEEVKTFGLKRTPNLSFRITY